MERSNQIVRLVFGSGSGLALVAAATAVLLPIRAHLPGASPALLLATPVVLAGVLGGRSAALVTAIGGGGALSFAFLPRVGALRVAGSEDVAGWVAFIALAGSVGLFAARAAERRAVLANPASVGAPGPGAAHRHRPPTITSRASGCVRVTLTKLPQNRRRAWRRSDVSFVETVYRGVLDRSPDAVGLDHYLNELADGVPRHRVLREIVESSESARHLVYSPGLRALAAEFWRARHDAVPPPRPLYFLHIMKTGGTTVTQALSDLAPAWPRLTDLFLDQLVCLPRPLLEQAVLVTGHLPYEAIAALPAGGAVCTVIRDPVERTLSHYAHLAARHTEEGLAPIRLDEFVSSDTWSPLWRNYQARQLAHEIGLADVWSEFSPAERSAGRVVTSADTDLPLQSLFDSAAMSESDDYLRSIALARLEAIQFAGVTNDLETLVARVAAYWDRPAPSHVGHLRVTAGRVQASDVPASILRTIRAGNEVDLALFERAQRA